MTRPVYFSALAQQRIAEANQTVATHAESVISGRCVNCAQAWPCGRRVAAEGTLRAYRQLPRRVPGAALPDRVRVSRPGFAWFGVPVPRKACDPPESRGSAQTLVRARPLARPCE